MDTEKNKKNKKLTFVEQYNNFLEGLHEVDVVVTVLLDLQQESKFREALGGKSLQQWAILLRM